MRPLRPLGELIYAQLLNFGPMTVAEIYDAIHTNNQISPEHKYTIDSIKTDLNDYSDSINRKKSGNLWPIIFERITEFRPQKWKIVDGICIDDVSREIERQIRQGAIASRPGQAEFSRIVRNNYGGQCAITGCQTPAALQAAHIAVYDGKDDNSADNGILLRADVHALLDALLITFAPDGIELIVSNDLADQSYAFLRCAKIARPVMGPAPSEDNITNHRARFMGNEHRNKG